MQNVHKALGAGLVGAASLNVVHETVRQFLPNAPKVHEVAMRANKRFILKPLGVKLSKRNLYWATLAGDVVSNSLYFALAVGAFSKRDPKSVWKRATVFGLGAGALTVALPPLVKLRQQKTANLPKTAGLTVGWYLLGALAAAAVFNAANREES